MKLIVLSVLATFSPVVMAADVDAVQKSVEQSVQRATTQQDAVPSRYQLDVSKEMFTMGKVDGFYAAYFPEAGKTVTYNDIMMYVSRVQPAANINGERVSINIAPDTKIVTVTVIKKVDSEGQPVKTYSGFAVFDTEGPRYAGPNIMTVGGSMSVPHLRNTRFTGYYTYGLPGDDTRDVSRYESVSARLENATPWGMLSAGYAYTEHNSLQNDVVGEQHARSEKVDLTFTMPLKAGFTLEAGLNHTKSKSILKDFELQDTLQYDSARIKIDAQHVVPEKAFQFGWSVEHEKGLTMKRDSDAFIQGQGETVWYTTTWEANAAKGTPWGTVSAKIGYQESSDGTPSAQMGYIGGPGRGSAFDAGLVSGQEVTYYDARFTFNPIRNITPFMGVNGGSTETQKLDAVQMGASTQVFGGAVRASISQAIKGEQTGVSKTRFSLNYSRAF